MAGWRQDAYVGFCLVSSSAGQWLSMARCTMGSCRPWNQITGMSPTSMTLLRFQIRQISLRWKAGDIDSDTTTMIGCLESVASDNAFHAMKTPVTARRHGRRAAALTRIAVMSMREKGCRRSNVPLKPIGKRTQLTSCHVCHAPPEYSFGAPRRAGSGLSKIHDFEVPRHSRVRSASPLSNKLNNRHLLDQCTQFHFIPTKDSQPETQFSMRCRSSKVCADFEFARARQTTSRWSYMK